ncbi:hypothetical protein ACEZNU_004518 [Vibrio parahaemolyticus]
MNSLGIPFTARTNGLEVLESGVVHVTTDDLEFTLDNITIRFRFEDDTNDTTTRYKGGVENGVLTFRLFNFKNTFGEGPQQPLLIAQIRGRNAFLMFYVNTNVNGSGANQHFREFKYSFLLEPERGTA